MTMTVAERPTRLGVGGWRPAVGGQLVGELHASGRRVRADALPEHQEYRDGGCELAPCCLRCPLVRCRYDEPGGARRLLLGSRDEALQQRREEGAGIDELAREFGLSRRSVFRVLARGRNGSGALAPAGPHAQGGTQG